MLSFLIALLSRRPTLECVVYEPEGALCLNSLLPRAGTSSTFPGGTASGTWHLPSRYREHEEDLGFETLMQEYDGRTDGEQAGGRISACLV